MVLSFVFLDKTPSVFNHLCLICFIHIKKIHGFVSNFGFILINFVLFPIKFLYFNFYQLKFRTLIFSKYNIKI